MIFFSIYRIYYIVLLLCKYGETLTRKQITVDITPTWRGLLPYMMAVLEDGTHEGKEIVKENFQKMATAADLAVEVTKE